MHASRADNNTRTSTDKLSIRLDQLASDFAGPLFSLFLSFSHTRITQNVSTPRAGGGEKKKKKESKSQKLASLPVLCHLQVLVCVFEAVVELAVGVCGHTGVNGAQVEENGRPLDMDVGY